jgi:G3E family GTPase
MSKSSPDLQAARVIPVILVTGFLGSGKTTFLRHLMQRQAGRRFVYLVNDFSAVDVDAQLLREASGDVLSIPGGSIFCRCLVTEFIGALRRIADGFDTAEAPVEGVVIEASGMANPRVAGELLQDTGLAARFRLAGVICLVDPGSLHKLLHTLPAVRAQIEAADLALVNKADLHDEATLARTEQALREIQPGLAIQRCTRADVAVQPFTGTSQALRIHGELAGCRDPDYLSATVRFRPGQRCEAAAVLACLNAEADMLLRAKGFVPTREGFVALEWSVGNSALSPAPPGIRVGALAIITRGDESARLDRLVAALEGHR